MTEPRYLGMEGDAAAAEAMREGLPRMGVMRRGLPDPDPAEMADRLQRRANQVLALEDLNMELAAKLGEAEHQLEGAVEERDALREAAQHAVDVAYEFSSVRRLPEWAERLRNALGGQ